MGFVRGLFVTFALASKALAYPAPGATPGATPGSNDGDSITCVTEFGSRRADYIQTETSTTTRTITQEENFYESVDETITPSPTTITMSETETSTAISTAETETDTITTTLIETFSETETNSITETQSETTTVYSTSTSTSTIPAPATFTPITSESGYVAKRDASCPNNKNKVVFNGDKGDNDHMTPSQYPRRVNCIRSIVETQTKTITTTVPGSTGTLDAQTSSTTTTFSETITSTMYPADVSTTETETSSTTVTTTVDETSTTTTTATVTIETVVPTTINGVCASSNVVNTANGGKYIGQGQTSGGGSFKSVSGITTAYACCLACHTTYSANCRGSMFWGTNTCYLFYSSTCSPNTFTTDKFYSVSSYGVSSAIWVSNGPCGMVINGGNL